MLCLHVHRTSQGSAEQLTSCWVDHCESLTALLGTLAPAQARPLQSAPGADSHKSKVCEEVSELHVLPLLAVVLPLTSAMSDGSTPRSSHSVEMPSAIILLVSPGSEQHKGNKKGTVLVLQSKPWQLHGCKRTLHWFTGACPTLRVAHP